MSVAASTHGYDTVDPFRIDPRLGDDADFDALIEAADRQLYAAKAAGRNCMQAVVLTADGAPLQHNA